MKDLPMTEIYQKYQTGVRLSKIAQEYNVTILEIREAICNCNVCNNLPDILSSHNSKLKLPIKEIYIKYKNGMTLGEMSKEYNVPSRDIFKAIKEYCEKNNIKFILRPINNLPPDEILYKLCIAGDNYDKLSTEYGVSKGTIYSRIKKYCAENNLESPVYIKQKLNCERIYMQYKNNVNIDDIAKEYNNTTTTIRNILKKYCKENNINLIIEKKGSIQKKLPPSAEIYKSYKSGCSLKNLSDKYGVSKCAIKNRIIGYCEENNIEYIINKRLGKRKSLPMDDIYRRYKSNCSIKDLSNEYGVSECTIRNRIKMYCKERNIEYIPNERVYKKLNLPEDKICKLYQNGYTQNQIASIFNVSTKAIQTRIHEYNKGNHLKLNCQSLPMHKIYYQYINGVSSEELSEIYAIEEEILMQKLYEYCTFNNIYIIENKLQEIKNKQILLYHLKSVLKESIEQKNFNEFEKTRLKKKYRR